MIRMLAICILYEYMYVFKLYRIKFETVLKFVPIRFLLEKTNLICNTVKLNLFLKILKS